MDRYTYETARDKAERLEDLLAGHGITIASGSALERATLSIHDLFYKQQDRPDRDIADFRKLFSDMIGIAELGTQILATADHPQFDSLLPHLELLNADAILQNQWSPVTEQESNKVFELLVACWAMACGTEVTLDDPHELPKLPELTVGKDGGAQRNERRGGGADDRGELQRLHYQ